MATKPETRRTPPSHSAHALGSLRDRAFRAFHVGNVRVDLVAEPLLRRTESGLVQPIRVRSSAPLTRAMLRLADGAVIHPEPEGAPGDVRFFLPAVEAAVTIRVQFPELGDESIDFGVRPVRPWSVSLVHHSHFDIGYTDLQGRVITEQLAYLDDALRLAEADAVDGSSAFRWSVESVWVLREWIGRRSPETVERFMAQVRAGTIEIAALPFNLHTETCSTEELFGLLRYACEISTRYGLKLPVAYQTDVSGCVAGTVDALADAGVKYLSVAHNWGGRSVPYLGDGEQLPRLFRWASPAGNSVLVWMTTTAQGGAYMEGAFLGFDNSVERVEDLLPLFLLNEETLPFPYDENIFGFPFGDRDFDRAPYPWNELHLRVMGRTSDNSPPNRRLSEIVKAWNERWEYPHLKVTRTQDFFEEVEVAHANEIQTFTGDWNDWWADGIGSAARHLQMNRGAQAAISQAASVAAMLGEHRVRELSERIDAAWEKVELFDEHTWGAGSPFTFGDVGHVSGADQWHWKAEKAIGAEQDSWLLTQEVLRAFAERNGGAGDASVWIVNTAGRVRGGRVSAFLPESLVHTTSSIHLIDAETRAELPFIERNQLNPAHRDSGRFVELIVDAVPAFGARRVDVVTDDTRVRPAESNGTIAVARATEPVWHLDNGLIRVTVDPMSGAIASIRELRADRELVDQGSAFGFNAYVHDRFAPRGEVAGLACVMTDRASDLAFLVSRDTTTYVAFEDAGQDALGSWLRYRMFGLGVDSIVTTLRLDADADFVDITNRVAKSYTVDKESGFFAFPFALEQPTVRHEVSGSVAGTDIPVVPGGADYMHAVRDWVLLHAGDRAATLVTQDAPLIQVGDIALPFAPFPGTLTARESGTVFSWIHNNIWDTNFPTGQAFDMVFRYRVRGFAADSAEGAGVESADLALDLVRPLLAVAADPSGDPVETASLLAVDDRRIRLIGVTRTSRGTLLARLQSLAESEVSVDVTAGSKVSEAWRASVIGVRRAPLDVIDGRQVTFRVPRFGTTAIELRLE